MEIIIGGINYMDLLITLLPVILFMVLIYFVTIRPQKKRQEEHARMIDQLQSGDHVVTIGGLHGIVESRNDQAQTIELDCEGIYLTFERRAIAKVVSSNQQTVGASAQDLGNNQPTHTEETE